MYSCFAFCGHVTRASLPLNTFKQKRKTQLFGRSCRVSEIWRRGRYITSIKIYLLKSGRIMCGFSLNIKIYVWDGSIESQMSYVIHENWDNCHRRRFLADVHLRSEALRFTEHVYNDQTTINDVEQLDGKYHRYELATIPHQEQCRLVSK